MPGPGRFQDPPNPHAPFLRSEGIPDAPFLDLGPFSGLGLLPFCQIPTSRKHSTPHLNQPEILPNRLNLGGLYSSSLMDRGNIFNARRRAGSTPL